MLEEYIIHSYVLLVVGRILDNSTKDLKFAFTNLTPFTAYDAIVMGLETSAVGLDLSQIFQYSILQKVRTSP